MNEMLYQVTKRGVLINDPKKLRIQSRVRFGGLLRLVYFDLAQQVRMLRLGFLWYFIEPALQAATYYFLLSFVFRISGAGATFSFYLIAIVLWRSHSSLIVGSPVLALTKGYQYIDMGVGVRIAFYEFIAQEFLLFLLRFVVLLIFLLFLGPGIDIFCTQVVLPLFAMFCFSASISVWLAVGGVYFQDLGRLVGHVVWLWWYISPGLYTFDRLPEWAQYILMLNPFTYIFSATHKSLLFGEWLVFNEFLALVAISVISLVALASGLRFLESISHRIGKFI